MRIVDKGNDIIIEGHLYSLVCDTIGTATIKVYEDNTYLTSVTTDEYGFFHIVIPTSTVGVRNFKLIYEGDSNYTGSESTIIEVNVRDAAVLDEILLTSDKLVCQLGERFHFTATCQSQYDDDLANIQVQLKSDDTVIQTVTTGEDGKAYLKFTPNATGSYSITATSGNVSSDPIIVVVSEGNIYEIIADLNEFPGTYSKEEIDALLLALKTLLEESKADIGHIHNINDIPNLQALLDDKVTWEAFYNRGGGDLPIVADWSVNPSNTNVPSEKLTKNTLDTKSDVGHTHDDRYYTESEVDTALSSKQATLVSGTNIKTVNNNSLLGSGNITIQGGSNVDVVTSWEATLSDTKVPSEKLTKNSLDAKADASSLATVATTGDYDDLTDKPTIPSKISDLTNDSDFIEKSSTAGLVKNDGTIDTTSYSTFDGDYNNLSNKPTIPSASSTTPSADTSSGSYGSGTSYARSNHSHPKSSLYAESSHTHTKSQITDFPSLSAVATSGSYADLSNKPSIPSSSSDLSDGSNIVKKSSTSGLLKNDGTVDTTSYSTFSGSYNDLTSKPTIPSASTTTPSADTTSGSYGSGTTYARSNHTHPKSSLYAEATHSHTKSQISDFPTIPTKTSDLTNDGDGTNVFVKNNDSRLSDARTPTSHNHDDRYYTESEMDTALNGKQDTLVSGTSIKTINNTSLLGSGNITVGGGGNVPTKTSDLTNDGEDGVNPFVSDDDSRLSDARTPTSHTHTSNQVTDLINTIYPVGSIYMSVSNTSPQTLFGGTWQKIEDTFLLASGSTYANGATGGSANAVIVEHTHTQSNHSHGMAHTHSHSHKSIGYTNTSGSGSNRRNPTGYNASGVTGTLDTDTNAAASSKSDTDGATANINTAGESGTGKNMPPYLAVNVWKRTA